MEEEMEKLILAREARRGHHYKQDECLKLMNNYLAEFTRVVGENFLKEKRMVRYEEFYTLLAKVNSIIDNADLTLCLTSKYEYIRERRKI